MKQFITAAKEAAPDVDADTLEFEVDGVLCHAYKPQDGQLAILLASGSKHSPTEEMVAGFINFFCAVLDDDSQSYVVGKLLDRRDPFGIDEVQQITNWMMEEWGGHPTQSPSDSASSPQTGGQRSTPPTPQLI